MLGYPVPLKEKRIYDAKAGERPYKLSDGGGLFLLVTPRKGKLWRLKFRLEDSSGRKKENHFAIGKYSRAPVGETEKQAEARRGAGTFTLAEARVERDAAKALIKGGINPARHRKDAKEENLRKERVRLLAAEGAFGKVAAAWLDRARDRKGRSWAPGTKRNKQARVQTYLLPKLASKPISQIDINDILPILEEERKAAWLTVQIRGDLSAIFDYAVARRLALSNPMPGLRGLVSIPDSESKAKLRLPQIREFFAKLKAYRGYPETALCLRLIALTACRPGEAAEAQWSEFDLDARGSGMGWRS